MPQSVSLWPLIDSQAMMLGYGHGGSTLALRSARVRWRVSLSHPAPKRQHMCPRVTCANEHDGDG